MMIKNLAIAFVAFGGLLGASSASMAQSYVPGMHCSGDCVQRQINETNNHYNTYNCSGRFGCSSPTYYRKRQWGSEEEYRFEH